MRREKAIKQLANNLAELRDQYGVADLSIFGSVARNQADADCDLDVLIDFATTPGLLRYIELKNHLEDLLGIPVDIVTRKALKRQLRDTILSESARNWQLRAEDIFESIQNIQNYTEGMDYSTWCEDKKTFDAVVRNFEIISEAANHILADIQSRYPYIPWQQMRGIRNILIHEYFGVDEEVIWKAIKNDIPTLEKMFARLLEKLD